jgi:EAL domain-containing protein (putative c-di-GMP-specific phosphodiesterase class I)
LKKLSDLGFTIALDDFGSGYASVSYLQELSFDTIKLDGSLIDNVLHDEKSRQVLLCLVDLCHAAGARCVAEHIESHEQLEVVHEMGCDYGQGYCLGKPATSESMMKMLNANPDPSAIWSECLADIAAS